MRHGEGLAGEKYVIEKKKSCMRTYISELDSENFWNFQKFPACDLYK